MRLCTTSGSRVSADSLSRDSVNRPTRQKSPRCDDGDDDGRVRCRRWEVCVCTSAALCASVCTPLFNLSMNPASVGQPPPLRHWTNPRPLLCHLQPDSFIGGFTSSGRRLIGGDRSMHAIYAIGTRMRTDRSISRLFTSQISIGIYNCGCSEERWCNRKEIPRLHHTESADYWHHGLTFAHDFNRPMIRRDSAFSCLRTNTSGSRKRCSAAFRKMIKINERKRKFRAPSSSFFAVFEPFDAHRPRRRTVTSHDAMNGKSLSCCCWCLIAVSRACCVYLGLASAMCVSRIPAFICRALLRIWSINCPVYASDFAQNRAVARERSLMTTRHTSCHL